MADNQENCDSKKQFEESEIRESLRRDVVACEILHRRIIEQLRAYRDFVNQPLSFGTDCRCEICQRDFPSNSHTNEKN